MKALNVKWPYVVLTVTYLILGLLLVFHYFKSPIVISTITDKELAEGKIAKIRYNSPELRGNDEMERPRFGPEYNYMEPEDSDEEPEGKKDDNQEAEEPEEAGIMPLSEICPPGKNDVCTPPFKGFINKYRFSPQYHLSACVIEKSMSTMLAAIMCYLYDTQAFLDANRTLGNELFEHRFCKGKNEKASLTEIHQTAPNANWNYLAIIRDPIDRFLSGFTDKCVKETKRGSGKCYNCNGDLSCFVQKQYKRTIDYAKGKSNAISYEDVHFFPQSWRCGFSSHLSKYNLIQYGGHGEEFDRMTNQLFAALGDAGVEEKDIDWIASQMQNGRTSHATRTSPERQKIENELKNNKELMKMVVRMFYYDFLLFGFPLPTIKE